MKPTFFVIGAAKAGTTTFCHLLGQHPEIFFSPKKELHFFSFDETYARGIDWYESNFEGARETQQIGEGSTTYTASSAFPDAARRLAEYAPNARLIYLVRNPLERIASTWLQLRNLRSVNPFATVGVKELPDAFRVDVDFNRAVRLQAESLVDSTNYMREIAMYREFFSEEQILIGTFEELRSDPRAFLQRCFEFLTVDSTHQLANYSVHMNRTSDRRLARGFLYRFWSTPARRKFYTTVTSALPQVVRDSFSGLLTTPAAEQLPEWDPATRDWVLARLGEDSARFLEYYGYPPEKWDLATDA